jgi:hypothetical protein
VRLAEFKQRVLHEFGEDLSRATPDNVRVFASRLQAELSNQPQQGRQFELNETAKSYEEVLRQFFARVLEYPPEEAAIALWLSAIELAFGGLETPNEDDRTQTTFSNVTQQGTTPDPPEAETWM